MLSESSSFSPYYFNPRTYVRCDLFGRCLQPTEKNFNPRTYVRCDDDAQNVYTVLYAFQSTHLREVRS